MPSSVYSLSRYGTRAIHQPANQPTNRRAGRLGRASGRGSSPDVPAAVRAGSPARATRLD